MEEARVIGSTEGEQPAGPPATTARRTSFGGIVHRMKSAFKKEGIDEGDGGSTAEGVSASESKEQLEGPAVESGIVASESEFEPGVQLRSTRQQVFDQRARKIFAKYNLVVEPNWIPLNTGSDPADEVDRVHKSIRIRVHRYCHRCDTLFGLDKVCPSCEHKRCKKCPRSPTEKLGKHEAPRGAENVEAKRAKVSEGKGTSETPVKGPLLVIRNPRTGGSILVHNRPTHVARRTCHKCQAPFSPSSAQSCAGCGHVRCTKCPRTPSTSAAPTDRWQAPPRTSADGVLSSEEDEEMQLQPQQSKQERVFRRPRQRIRWTCDNCSTLFMEGQKLCGHCGHGKCDACRRLPPTKPQETLDPDVVRSLNERLSAIVIATAAS